MKRLLKQIIKKTPLYYLLFNWVAKRRQAKELVEWERKGKPVSPPHIVEVGWVKLCEPIEILVRDRFLRIAGNHGDTEITEKNTGIYFG